MSYLDDKLIQKLNSAGVTIQKSELSTVQEKRIPFGNLMLDIASKGGLPSGKIVRFVGHYSSGKSQVALKLFANNQTRCHNCWDDKDVCKCGNYEPFRLAYVDLENIYDAKWAVANGITITQDHNYVARIIPETAEATVDAVDALIRKRLFSVIIVDSLAAMVPSIELEKSLQDFVGGQVGAHAKVVNAACRKWVNACLPTADKTTKPPLIILINQLRQTTNQYAPETTPGGIGQGFASVFDLRLERKKYRTDKGDIKGLSEKALDKGVPVAQLIEFKVQKSRISSSGGVGEFWMWQDSDPLTNKKIGDISYGEALYEYAVRFKVLDKIKGDYVITTTGEAIGRSRDDVNNRLENDPLVIKDITDGILLKLNG